MEDTSTQQAQRDNLIVWVSLIFLMLVWGSTFILVKRGLETFPPSQVASLRLSSAMLPLLLP